VSRPSGEPVRFGWLLDQFVKTVSGTQYALVVSADGLLTAMSTNLDRTRADQLGAIVSGIASLARGASQKMSAGVVQQAIIEMEQGFLFLMNISSGAVLAVSAEPSCDVGLVGYEMALLVSRTKSEMTPTLIAELRRQLPGAGPVWNGPR
jgi:predicted regulator of Ras-like GTPase activity (Roadblock/LC7/MglB family)